MFLKVKNNKWFLKKITSDSLNSFVLTDPLNSKLYKYLCEQAVADNNNNNKNKSNNNNRNTKRVIIILLLQLHAVYKNSKHINLASNCSSPTSCLIQSLHRQMLPCYYVIVRNQDFKRITFMYYIWVETSTQSICWLILL